VVTKGARPSALRPPSSNRPLWIGLAAAVVVAAGGVAAAVVFTRGGTPVANSGPPVANSGPPVASGVPGTTSPPGFSGSTDPWNAPPPPAAPPARPTVPAAVAPPAAPAQAEASGDDDDDTDDDARPAKHGAKPAVDPMAEALDQLDQTIKSLPPEQQKRLSAYKNLAKLSAKDRMKRLQQLARQGVPELSQEITDLVIGQLPAIPGMPPGAMPPGAMPPGAPPPPAPTEWITNRTIDSPSGYDPAHVDVTAFIPWAVAQARKAIPDAQLIRIDASGVGPDGRANLKLATLASDHGDIDLRFISPSRGKRDPSQPLGVPRHDFKCEFRVMAGPDGVELMPIDFADCAKEHVVPVPRCSSPAVWTKAIQHKAPSNNAVGNLGYRSNGSRAVWYFDIGAGRDVAFSETFGDDC
jgi:hypothetical protein